MSLRVLLISANRCSRPDPVFPLGLAHLAAALRRAGHSVRWLDLLVEGRALADVLSEFQPQLTGISLRNIDDVLIRKREVYFDDLKALCATVRAHARCPVVLGGSGFSIFPAELLREAGADYGVCGAGEVPLVSLAASLESGSDPAAIPGLAFLRDGQVLINPVADVPACRLEREDLPADVLAYYLGSGGMLNVQTQRGCAFHCCYCTYPVIEGRTHQRRPPADVAAEFEQAARLGARYVFVVDSVFNSSPRHIREICEAILARGVKISWGCFLRPQGLTPELVELMARAGLGHIEFGSDSFSDPVLAAYHKGFTFEDVRRSSELAHGAGIDYCHFLICGGPGETRATLAQSFERSRSLAGAVMMAVVGMRIYPGTQLFRQAVADGLLVPDANLLEPQYFLSPALTSEEVFAQLETFARQAPNWIIGDPVPAYAKLVARLRQRGVVGPLWSYLSMIQRLWPAGVAPAPATS